MPANNAQQITIGTPVVNDPEYSYSREDSIALLRQIPATTGTILVLPARPTIGESYDFVDVDGSCSSSSPITLTAADSAPIQGALDLFITSPFAWGRVVWSGTQWALSYPGPNVGPLNPPANGSWSQVTWYIDELGVLPTSSNNPGTNNGLTRATAIRTKAELFRRMGTLFPFINVQMTVYWISVATGTAAQLDPWMLKPTYGPNGALMLTADPQSTYLTTPTFVGTIATLTAKSTNTTPGNALQITVNATSGALAPDTMLVNLDRGNSVAFVQRNTSGATWQIEQPQTAYVPGTFPALFPPSQNNAWAAGDRLQGFTLPGIDAAVLGGYISSFNQTSFYSGTFVYRINIVAQTGTFDELCSLEGNSVIFVECAPSKVMIGNMLGSALDEVGCPIFSNCSVRFSGYTGGSAIFSGGAVTIFGDMWGCSFSGDVIITNFSSGNLGRDRVNSATIGRAFLDTGVLWTLTGFCSSLSQGPETCVMYGPGTGNFMQYMNYSNGSPSGTNAFRCAIDLGLNGHGYSASTSAGVTTIHGGITVSGPNLDAAAGAAGFNGQAFNLCGACITNVTQN